MKLHLRFAGAALLLGAVGAGALWLLRGRLEGQEFRGAILGIALVTAGAIAGMTLVSWAFDKGHKQFFATVMLGILGRLVIYGGTLAYVALRTRIDPVAFAVSLLSGYVVLMILELWFVVRSLKRA